MTEQVTPARPGSLDLPTDWLRTDAPVAAAGSVEFDFEEDCVQGIAVMSRREGTDRVAGLLGALLAVLHRCSGQDDLCIGVSHSGSAGTAVLRSDMTGSPTAQQLIHRTAQSLSAASDSGGEHQRVEVLFETCSTPPQWPAETSPYDLHFQVFDAGQGVWGRVVYRTDLFETATVERLVRYWKTAVDAVIAGPGRPAHRIVLSDPGETEMLIRDWSSGPDCHPGDDISRLIDSRASREPGAIAVVGASGSITYGELGNRSETLAGYLRSRGVRAEVPVGVCLDRGIDQIVALIAVLKAGGAYVPMDPMAPGERIRYMISDTSMPIVVTQGRIEPGLLAPGVETICMDRISWADLDGHGHTTFEEPVRNQAAYICYTSGSTGQPKGVVVERGPLSDHCREILDRFYLSSADRVLQFAHTTFDVSLEQILPTLASGARLVLRGDEIWTPAEFLEVVRDRDITVMSLTPAYFNQVTRAWSVLDRPLESTSLRLVVVGGDRLSESAVGHWRTLAPPGVRLLNGYGPTETVITATFADTGAEIGRSSIGRPIGGRRVYILDDADRPTPVGVVGEIHIAGPLVARGYLNLPDLTEERFVANPFVPGERMYRSGDLGRYLGDGRICYVGRRDQQVKIRGFRVELGEIEAAVESHPAVIEAVVVTSGEGDNKELVAYATGSAAMADLQGELRCYLRTKLPEYMQPAVIMVMAEMPRLPNGKTDRRGLPSPVRAPLTDGHRRLPESWIEGRLLEIWEGLLEVRPIGTDDSFFDLGGHSLLAAELLGQVEATTGRRVSLSTLFAHPTIRQLASVLRGDQTEAGPARPLAVQTGGSRTPFFFLHGDWTGGAFYCFTLARACGPDQPFYVIEPLDFDPASGPPSIEEMARSHVETMRRQQPDGPYRIGGFCNGGLLAYEMARQIEQSGGQVEVLALVNPVPPDQTSPIRDACDRLGRMLARRGSGGADLYLRLRHAGRHIYRRVRPNGSRVLDFAKLLVIEPRLQSLFPPRSALYRDYVGVFDWSVTAYRSRHYRGPATFFWAADEPGIDRGWEPVLAAKREGRVERHAIPGHLMSSVTLHAEAVGRGLKTCLEQVEDSCGIRS